VELLVIIAIIGILVALVFSGLAASQAMAQPYDQVVNLNFMREGVQPYTGTNGVGAAVDSGTNWNDLELGNGNTAPQVFNNLVDSIGLATSVVVNNNWRFIRVPLFIPPKPPGVFGYFSSGLSATL